MAYELIVAGQTDVGRERQHNEDNFILVPDENLFVVADGMGGHSFGEVASSMAVEILADFYRETREDVERTWAFKEDRKKTYDENRFIAGVKLANLKIYERAQSDISKRGMGTTVVGAHVVDDQIFIGHCGDSRAYRFRNGGIEQLTEDHSLLNHYKKEKQLTDEELENFPMKNIILRALGMAEVVDVDLCTETYTKDDLYLLCSDGLSGMITDADMLEIVNQHTESLNDSEGLTKLCDHLISQANENGGKDNVTLVLIRVASSSA